MKDRDERRGRLCVVRVILFEHSGHAHEIDAEANQSLMQAAVRANVPGIVADCGGALSCATCHVYIRPEWTDIVGPPSDMETAMLEMAIDPTEKSRLSCQIKIGREMDGLAVDIPKSQF
jgi:2Fe-2S ferredoxin